MIRLHESWYDLLAPVVPKNVLPTPNAFLRGGRKQGSLERIMDLMYLSDALKTFGGSGGQPRAFFGRLADGVGDQERLSTQSPPKSRLTPSEEELLTASKPWSA
jgi:hypothetical protein